MNGYDDLALGGSPDLEALRRTDALLDRLGRREPDPRDLDDPVAAALAVLAGDVDLAPVPVLDTRRALTFAGLWPVPGAVATANGADPPTVQAASVSRTDRGVSAPRAVPDGEVLWSRAHPETRRPLRRSRRHRAASPTQPRLDHPLVLRIRPRAGMVAAAALVVLGAGVSAVANDSLNPISGMAGLMGRLTHSRSASPSQAQQLAQTQLTALAQADTYARLGDAPEVQKIIARVQAELQKLPGADQQKINQRIAQVQGDLTSAAAVVGPDTSSAAATSDGYPTTDAAVPSRHGQTGVPSTWSSRTGQGYTRTAPGGSAGSFSRGPTAGGYPTAGPPPMTWTGGRPRPTRTFGNGGPPPPSTSASDSPSTYPTSSTSAGFTPTDTQSAPPPAAAVLPTTGSTPPPAS